MREAEAIGQVDSVFGDVTAVAASGGARLLQVGDPVFAGESIQTDGSSAAVLGFQNGNVKGIAGDASIKLSPDFYEPGTSPTQSVADPVAEDSGGEGAVAAVEEIEPGPDEPRVEESQSQVSAELDQQTIENPPAAADAAVRPPIQSAEAEPVAEVMAIGEVTSSSGRVFAESDDGTIRELQPGDPVFLSDTVMTDPASMAILSLSDGSRRGVGSEGKLALDSLSSELVLDLEPAPSFTAVGIGEPDRESEAAEPWITEGAVQRVAELQEDTETQATTPSGPPASNDSEIAPAPAIESLASISPSAPEVGAAPPTQPVFTQFAQVGDAGPVPASAEDQQSLGIEEGNEGGFGPYFIDRNASDYRADDNFKVGYDTDALQKQLSEVEEETLLDLDYAPDVIYVGPIEIDLQIEISEESYEPESPETNQPPTARDDSDVVDSDLGSSTTGNVIDGVVGGVFSIEGLDDDPNQDPLLVTQAGATTSLDALTSALGDLTGTGALLEAIDVAGLLPIDTEVPALTPEDVPEGGSVEITGLYGILALDDQGGYTYTVGGGALSNAQELLDLLPADTTVPEVFQYTVSDGRGGTDTASLTIDLGGANRPPVARDDSDVVESDLGSFTTGNVINGVVDGVASTQGQDEDPNQDPLMITQAGATTSLDALTTALGDLTGTGELLEAIDLSGLLPIDTEVPALTPEDVPEGGSVEITGLYGKLVLDDQGGYTYTVGGGALSNAQELLDLLPADTTVPEVFQYTVSDGRGGTDTATLTIDVGGTNQPPVARDDSDVVESDLGSSATGNVIDGVVDGVASTQGQDEDPNQDPLMITQAGATTSLDALTSALGDLTGTGALLEAIDLSGLLPIDTEVPALTPEDVPEGGSVEITGLYGKLVLDDQGGYTYTVGGGALSNAQELLDLLPADTTVPEVFQYTVSDGRGGTDTASLTIDVGGTNQPPVARDDSDVVESDLGSFTTGNVINGVVDGVASTQGQDEDPNQDPLTITQAGATTSLDALTSALGDLTGTGELLEAIDLSGLLPIDTEVPALTPEDVPEGGSVEITGLYGKLVLDDQGGYTYTVGGGALSNAQELLDLLPADTTVPEVFQYTVSDGRGGTDTASLTIDVGGTNQPPVARDDSDVVESDLGSFTTGNVINGVVDGVASTQGQDEDPNEDPLTITQAGATTSLDALTTALGDLTGTGELLEAIDLSGLLPIDTEVPALTPEDVPEGGSVEITGLYGKLVLDDQGGYTYTVGGGALSNAQELLDLLPADTTVPEVFQYTVSDGRGGTDTATLTIDVGGTNQPPVARDDSDVVESDLGSSATGNVIDGVVDGVASTQGQDEDPNQDPLMITQAGATTSLDALTSALGDLTGTGALLEAIDMSGLLPIDTEVPALTPEDVPEGGTVEITGFYGKLVLDDQGGYTYTMGGGALSNAQELLDLLPADTTVPEVFQYTVSDGRGGTDTATLTIDVGGTNQPPVAYDDTDTVVDDGNAETDDQTSGNVISGVPGGVDTDGNPADTDPNAADIPGLEVNQAVVSIDTGVLGDLLGTLDPDGTLLGIPDQVLAGTPVAVTVDETTDAAGGADVQGLYGNLKLFTDGSYTYTAGDGYLNPAVLPVGVDDVLSLLPGGETYTDVFAYTIEDPGGLSSNVANLAIEVGPENVAPVAYDDTDTVVDDGNAETDDQTLGNVISGVPGGVDTDGNPADTDPNAADIPGLEVNQAVVSIDTGVLGDLLGTLDPDGTLLGIPDQVLAGTPVAVTVDETTDAAGGADVQGLYGHLKLFTDGSYTYTAGDGYLNPAVLPVGVDDVLSLLPGGETYTDVFAYTIEDPGGLSSNVANLTIEVGPENVAPVANPDADSVMDTGASRDLNPDTNDSTTGNVIAGVGGTGAADEDENQNDTLNVTKVGVGPASIGILTSLLGETGVPLAVAVEGDAANRATAGTPKEIQGLYGTLQIDSLGDYIYTVGGGLLDAVPGATTLLGLVGGETLTEQFSYTIDDDAGATSSTTLMITVGPTTPPIADDLIATATEDEGIAEPVNFSGSDADGDPITFSVVEDEKIDGTGVVGLAGTTYQLTDGGSITVNLTNTSFTFDPGADFQDLNSGDAPTASFHYIANDLNADSAPATVDIVVEGINDSPVFADNASIGSIDEDPVAGREISQEELLAFVSDVDSDPADLSVASVSVRPDYGTVMQSAGGWTFTPAENFNGDVPLNVVVTDGEWQTNGVVNLTVNPVNDAPEVAGPVELNPVPAGLPVTILASDLLATSSDVDGDTLGVKRDSVTLNPASPGQGTLVPVYDEISGNLVSVTYTPDFLNAGDVLLDFIVTDGELDAPGTATVQVDTLLTSLADGISAAISETTALLAESLAAPAGEPTETVANPVNFNGGTDAEHRILSLHEVDVEATDEFIIENFDHVIDGDALEIYDLLINHGWDPDTMNADGDTLQNYLHFEEDAAEGDTDIFVGQQNTVLAALTGDVQDTVVLKGVRLDELTGSSDAGALSDAQIIDTLIGNGTLQIRDESGASLI